MKSPGIEAFKAEREGKRICILCDEPLPKSKPRHAVLCGDEDCTRTYWWIFKIDQQAAARARAAANGDQEQDA